MKFFTADLHLFHKNILKYCPKRASSLELMKERIVSRWNAVATNEDTVYVLGDFALGKSDDIRDAIRSLNGKKILIYGNHDRHTRTWFLRAGFDQVWDGARIWIDGNLVELNHYPFRPGFWTRLRFGLFDRKMLRYMDRMPENRCQVLLHGHCHAKYWIVKGSMIDVGWDAWDGLISERQIAQLIRGMKRLGDVNKRRVTYGDSQ